MESPAPRYFAYFIKLGNISNMLRYLYGKYACEAGLPHINGNVVKIVIIGGSKAFDPYRYVLPWLTEITGVWLKWNTNTCSSY